MSEVGCADYEKSVAFGLGMGEGSRPCQPIRSSRSPRHAGSLCVAWRLPPGSLPEGAGCGDRKAPPCPSRSIGAAGLLLLMHATSNTNPTAQHSAGVSGLGVAGGVAAGAAGGRAVPVLAALVAKPSVGNGRRKPASAPSPGTLVRPLRQVLSPRREQGDTSRDEERGADHAPVCYSGSQQLPIAPVPQG